MPEEPITLRDVFNRVETYGQCLVKVEISLATLTQKVADLPEIPKQPCSELTGHLDKHEKARALWQKPVIGVVVGVVEMAVVGLVCFFIGRG